jgi:hypothetical protein
MARDCADCQRYLETIRELGQVLGQIKKLAQLNYDRPQQGGRPVADRGFRST